MALYNPNSEHDVKKARVRFEQLKNDNNRQKR